MKTYNIDYSLLNKDLIKQSIITVCRNKHKKNGASTRKYRKAQEILSNVDFYTSQIYDMILSFAYVHKLWDIKEPIPSDAERIAFRPAKPYTFSLACDNGKIREISSIPLYPDQIIHQVLIDASKQVLLKSMYKFSCGSIPGRGAVYGKKYLAKNIDRCNRECKSEIKYAAQLDIKKCYPHVSHRALKQALRQKFRGKLFLSLCDAVIDSHNEALPGEEPRGLPIGYYTSQWFCNFLLTGLDHIIKEEFKIKIYIRNMDDMVLFYKNKKTLHKYVNKIAGIIAPLGFTLKENWQVYRFDYMDNGKRKGRAVDVLGYRFFRDKTILRKRIYKGILKIVHKIHKRVLNRKPIPPHIARSFMARMGWLKYCDSYRFYHKRIKPYIRIQRIKEVIRKNESRINNKA